MLPHDNHHASSTGEPAAGDLPTATISTLVTTAGLELQVLGEVKKRLKKQTAPDFSIFEFLRSDEVGLSSCLAALLDPSGSHGQGPRFLELFLDHLQVQSSWREKLEDAHVSVETQANGMRRLDITICLPGNRWIGIENKPWAVDQVDQLADYGRHLERTAASGQWMLVYLSEREPPRASIPQDLRDVWSRSGNFQHMKFTAAVDWLRRCENESRPPTVRLFLQELATFVSREVCGVVEMEQGEIVKQLVLQSEQSLRAALIVSKSVPDIKHALLQSGLREPYTRSVENAGLEATWHSMEDMGSSAGFGARLPGFKDWGIRFEFERAGLAGLFWGLKRPTHCKDGRPEDAAISDQMRALGFGAGKSSSWWAWYSTDCGHFGVPPAHRNWYSNEEPWLQLLRGPGFAEKFAEHTTKVARGLRPAE
jgi:hypothetical protein